VPTVIEAALIARTRIASGVFDLVFAMKSPSRLDFRAGQFVTLRVPSGTRDGFLRRSYSIASATHAGEQIRFIVREVPGGQASDFLLHLPLGQTIAMAGPYGVFMLEPSHPGDVVFGATGTGLAAVMPMLEELARAPNACRDDVSSTGACAAKRTFSLATRSRRCADGPAPSCPFT
jgi:ferredoxin-NADP reductase